MATLILDIETIGTPWGEIDETTKAALIKWIKHTHDQDESELHIRNVKSQLGLSPLTGSIVSLALYDLERQQGVVYVVSNESTEAVTDSSYVIKTRTEKELLEDFWEGSRSYDVFVTFNGRQFDVPFLLHRSVANEVRPIVELNKHRYITQQSYPYHVDLMEELTFNRAMLRRSSLHMFCQAYGIERPKEARDSTTVAQLVYDKDFVTLANYNAADVVATTALYDKWKQYLAPASFINSLEF
jgi:uncharacterized protein YprB with RNaseH-like and TPR domain